MLGYPGCMNAYDNRAVTAIPDSSGGPLPPSFFARSAPEVARDLLGKYIFSSVGGARAGGRIVETEAYLGPHDPGSHAATRAVTTRNAVMYAAPGTAYVYFTYGQHHMLNLVAEPEGTAGAVLIRAIEPTTGLQSIRLRRCGVSDQAFADGPGKVAEALGVTLDDNAVTLGAGRLEVLDGPVPAEPILVSGRVGLTEGHELPLRFYLAGHPGVSRGRIGPPSPRKRSVSDRDAARDRLSNDPNARRTP